MTSSHGEGAADRYAHFFRSSVDLLAIAGFDGYFKELNPAWKEILGYRIEDLVARPFLDFVHPDDREATIAEMGQLGHGIGTLLFENRYRAADGTYRWLRWTATPDPEGGLIYAIARDVTERKKLTEELALLQRLLRTVAEAGTLDEALHGVVTGICETTGWVVGEAWVLAEGGAILRLSPTHYAAEGYESFGDASASVTFRKGEGFIGRAWEEGEPLWSRDVSSDPTFSRTEAATAAGLKAAIAVPVMQHGEAVAVLGFFMPQVSDEDRGFEDLVATIASQLGAVVGRRRAEDEVARLAEEFRTLSLKDDLTGLHNRRGFILLAEHRLKVAERQEESPMVVFADLDGLKAINDEHGHHAGDQAITAVARALRESLRESDVIGRLGGDEFAALVPSNEANDAALRDRIASHVERASEDLPFTVAVSLGFARPEGELTSLQELLRAADQEMYREKSGRSR